MKQRFLIMLFLCLIFLSCRSEKNALYDLVLNTDGDWIIRTADTLLAQPVVTVTRYHCDRSQGGRHDFYSEGDYWWPDPDNPDGPYIRRDGQTNPANFTAHRRAMRAMSRRVATLTAAFLVSGEERYATRAKQHLLAWFVTDSSRMNPNMNYAQAIKGIVPGRGVGLIDGIHLVEPAQAAILLNRHGQFTGADFDSLKNWFANFLTWMQTHPYGIDERDRKNNHGSCWVLQAAQYAKLTGDEKTLQYCRHRFKEIILPDQLAADGSYPMELKRTKPYGYSLFNLDIWAALCHILYTPQDNLWNFALPDGRSTRQAFAYMYTYIKEKKSWPLPPDVMYWDEWPVRHPALLFAGHSYKKQVYLFLWQNLKRWPESAEGQRNFPIRQPLLWCGS